MKNRYFVKTKEPGKEIASRYGIPYSTLTRWSKEQNDGRSQKGYTFDRLSLLASFEIDAEDKIRKLFYEKELLALWGAFAKSTLPSVELFTPGAMEWGFSEYCEYESMEAAQFGDIEELKKSVTDKIKQLCAFERYVLLEYLHKDNAN
ncbi:hypothetical protein [Sulfurovum mangrovi]|uniref:hypothetical protein n=1 Tax=Sulfurovum mangrovi TaxID=2893889 RepID=UPI001E3B174D|nr:hypothetical protein [Sulfurovum mangrovi]UFH59855.1 hypothetical protein LN246_03180 [Sulfurovum mangrovi]UFH59906.1 hypothetical protein LN246_03440 [Sulfurovum mangrovi]